MHVLQSKVVLAILCSCVKNANRHISMSICLCTPHQCSSQYTVVTVLLLYLLHTSLHSHPSSHGDQDRYRNRWVSLLGSLQNLGRLLQGGPGSSPWQRPTQQCHRPRAAGAAAARGGSARSTEDKVTELTTRCRWWWHCTIEGTHIATSVVLQKLWLGYDERLEILSFFWRGPKSKK